MEMRHLGKNGPKASQVGLGCMGMSDVYGPADEKESIATVHAAMEAGITLLDTGDFYGMGHNEILLREALKGGKREKAFIQVKYGAQRSPDGAFVGFDTSPGATKTALSVMELLRELATPRGRAVVVVTHAPRLEKFADRVVRVEDGRIQETL